jgi:hypothetical protein
MKNFQETYLKKKLETCLFLVLLMGVLCFGQEALKDSTRKEVNLKIVSAEINRFDKPIRIGPGERAFEYQEALVLKVQVNQQEFDELPPSMEPFLYIGKNEYRIFHIDRSKSDEGLILTFHIRNWEKVEDGEPLVLTIDHGDPVRNAEKYKQRKLPRFNKKIIVDKRKSEQ